MAPQFAAFDRDAFLRDAWQRQPMLIRNPWRGWVNPLEPDELAGLACEPGIESRLIVRTGAAYALEHGPFAEDRFAQLGAAPWTLLVQGVDHHVPGVADLVAPFRFIPDWRIDDVMVSYAVDGGGVGAHYDQYDVFLVQGLGQRRWQVGPRCDARTPFAPHADLRLLADFAATDEWVLDPGDMLYVPPGFAHRGVAVGDDCMTYSVGFRAPSAADLLAGWSAHMLDTLDEDDRYTDAGLERQGNPGEITGPALDRLHGMVAGLLADRQAFARWFGAHTTEPKTAIDWRPDRPPGVDAIRQALARGQALLRNPAVRFALVRGEGEGMILFVDGESHDCTGPAARFAELICAQPGMVVPGHLAGSAPVAALVARLVEAGAIAFDAAD